MYTGMADVAALTNDEGYLDAIDTIWNDVADKKLYITGGIGATGSGTVALAHNGNLTNSAELNEMVLARYGVPTAGEMAQGNTTDTALPWSSISTRGRTVAFAGSIVV